MLPLLPHKTHLREESSTVQTGKPNAEERGLLEMMCPINFGFLFLQYQFPKSKIMKVVLKIQKTDLHLCSPFPITQKVCTARLIICNMQKLCVAAVSNSIPTHPPYSQMYLYLSHNYITKPVSLKES